MGCVVPFAPLELLLGDFFLPPPSAGSAVMLAASSEIVVAAALEVTDASLRTVTCSSTAFCSK